MFINLIVVLVKVLIKFFEFDNGQRPYDVFGTELRAAITAQSHESLGGPKFVSKLSTLFPSFPKLSQSYANAVSKVSQSCPNIVSKKFKLSQRSPEMF